SPQALYQGTSSGYPVQQLSATSAASAGAPAVAAMTVPAASESASRRGICNLFDIRTSLRREGPNARDPARPTGGQATSGARSAASRAQAAAASSSNSSVNFFIIVPPSSSASTIVTARR